MQSKINNLLKNPLIVGTLIVTISTNVLNVFSYVFQYIMLRALTPDHFKLLFNLFALMSIITVFSGVMSQVAIKTAAKLKAKQDFQHLTGLFKQLLKVNFIFGLLVLLIFFGFTTQIALALNLPSQYLKIFSIFILIGMVAGLPISFLNGLLRFKSYGFVTVLAGVFKVFFPVVAIILGYEINGVIFGLILGSIASGIVAFALLKKNLRKVIKPYAIGQIVKTAIPLSFITLFTTLLFNIDVLMVNKFLSSTDSSTYSSVALVGRIILYGASAVAVVLMPIISEKTEKGHAVVKTLFFSLLIVTILGGIGTLIMFLYPNLINNYVFGGKYPSAVPFLGIFSLFMLLYALMQTMTGFFIGTTKNIIIYILLIGSLTQIVGIMLFHSDINQVILVNITSMLVILFFYMITLYKHFIRSTSLRME
jgi:O-antigen/teichoic acid export membrane protein